MTAGTAVGVGDDDALGRRRRHGIVWRARRRRRRGGGRERCPGGVELPPTRGTGKPIVSNLGETPWEHVLEEPREERRRGQRAARQLPGTTITEPKRDATVVDVFEAIVGDRDPENVAAEVLEHLLPGGRRLHVDDPIARPGLGGDLIEQAGPAHGVAHLAAKDGREDVAGEEEVGTRASGPSACRRARVPHR